MGMTTKEFGMTPAGEKVTMYILSNSKGMSAEIMDFGATLVGLKVPNDKGEVADVVLGYDSLEKYQDNSSYFGVTVGPNANRIGGAAFTLEGVRYEIQKNDGDNNCHSHNQEGYHKRMWQAEISENSVKFVLEDKDGSLGFPGNRKVSVAYTLDEDNRLTLEYSGSSDKNTILNMTNHSYFNLKGHGNGSIEDHILYMAAKCYTPTDPDKIPTGEIAPVEGTPMDFTKPRTIGSRIDDDFAPLALAGGYDHNWVLDNWNGQLKLIAAVTSPEAGREMKVYTTLPGVQLYAGGGLSDEKGKAGAVYERRGGFCLETQYYPDTANKPQFPSAVFGPERPYHSVTVFAFS